MGAVAIPSGNKKIEFLTDTVTLGVNVNTYTVPSDRQLIGVTKLSRQDIQWTWLISGITVSGNTITVNGGRQTVDTQSRFTITYIYIMP